LELARSLGTPQFSKELVSQFYPSSKIAGLVNDGHDCSTFKKT
jgi:hypothetical protein